MIILHKLNEVEFSINCEFIEKIAENPDTTITLTNGNVYIVKESMREVINKCIQYKRSIFSNFVNEAY